MIRLSKTFDQLSIGQEFTLRRNSPNIFTKIENFYYESKTGSVYKEENNCTVYDPPSLTTLNKIRANARTYNNVRQSVGLTKTPYGWE